MSASQYKKPKKMAEKCQIKGRGVQNISCFRFGLGGLKCVCNLNTKNVYDLYFEIILFKSELALIEIDVR